MLEVSARTIEKMLVENEHRILCKYSIQSTDHFHPINTGASGCLAPGTWCLRCRWNSALLTFLRRSRIRGWQIEFGNFRI